MTDPTGLKEVAEEPAEAEVEASVIPLSDPDITSFELDAVDAAMRSPRLSSGAGVEAFEEAFAAYLGRKYAIAVPSGTLGLLLALKACNIGPGDEVIASPYSFRETTHAIALAGAKPVFADIDYWAGTLVPEKAEARITEKTKAIVAGNTNGHPAPWGLLREVAKRHNLVLLEDSTEAIGARYQGALVGTFGDASVFDFSQPSLLTCGEGGMVVTDDVDIAVAIRRHRSHKLEERSSVVVSSSAPYQAGMSDISAAMGIPPPTLTRIVDKLVEGGFVLRRVDATDRRRVLIYLSVRGKTKVRRLARQEAQVKALLVEEFGEDTAILLIRTLARVGELPVGRR